MASTSQISETLPQFLVDVSGVMNEVQVVNVDASEEEQPDDVDKCTHRVLFSDLNQVSGLNQDADLQASHAGDTSRAEGVNTAFWNTFGSFMPYNANLFMSVQGSMQQSQLLLQPTSHPTSQPPVEPTPQRTPEPHAASQQSGGRIVPSGEHEMAIRPKILIEPEGDMYLLYYPFTKYEMLLKYYYWLPQHDRQFRSNFEVSGAKQLKNLEPTVDELYKDTHMHRKKGNQGNWVCKKSELRLPSTDDSSRSPPLFECDIWVQENLTSKGRVYGFGAEGVVMKQWSHLSVSSRSSSVNNYDVSEMAMRLNKSVWRRLAKKRCKTFASRARRK
ncbi:LOW QUALITY PROTEIN: hypothetical protein Cgig2_009518 [Carnegiea gigantea]|uniref:Uncharacterized protein n=1 Tax=Carnegiea gigantea TaxID=171969 RepID=A0A9Q1JKV3_9CARY|nr:LOW QUALITY PROTEIN: hypothetical protein Cgig2_009518 [Carnegiea gigantea]